MIVSNKVIAKMLRPILGINAPSVAPTLGVSTPIPNILDLRNSVGIAKAPEVVKRLENILKSLGINANYSENMNAALIGTEGLLDLINQGYKVPKNIILGTKNKYINSIFTNHDVFAIQSGFTIHLNSNVSWHNIEETTNKMAHAGHISSNNPKHVIYHEVGHYQHRFGSFLRYAFSALGENKLPIGVEDFVKETVSDYGASSITDFVAEVFAGHVAGKKYPKDILDLYYSYGGPTLKL